MNPTIKEILNLTHDKWTVEIKDRVFFKDFLERFLELQPQILEDLTIIVDLGQQDDKLVIMRGVLNILESKYSEEYKSIMTRYYSDVRKKEMFDKVLGNFVENKPLNKNIDCVCCGNKFHSTELVYKYICSDCRGYIK